MADPSVTLRFRIKTEDNTEAWLRDVEDWIRDWIHETVMLIEEYAVEECPVNMGELRASIHAVVEMVAGTVIKARVETSCGYGFWVEKGRDPGKFPPVWNFFGGGRAFAMGPLADWAERVLGDREAAFPVARAIAARGLDPQPYLYPAYERALSEQLPKLKAKFH